MSIKTLDSIEFSKDWSRGPDEFSKDNELPPEEIVQGALGKAAELLGYLTK